MKIGIIIIFEDTQKDMDKYFLVKILKHTSKIEFCLVNHSSNEQISKLLKDIKNESIPNVSIVDIKKYKSENFAIRAGTRYLHNNFELEYIGYINFDSLNNNDKNLKDLIKIISENEIKSHEKKPKKQPLFKNIFSVIDYLNNPKTIQSI